MNLPTLITRLTTPWGVLILGIIATLWLRQIVTAPNLWLGDDTGTYLTTMNFVLGSDNTGVGGARPPLIGYLLIPFVTTFGTLTGAKVLALLVSVAGTVPFFLLTRRIVRPYVACIGSLIYTWWVFADPLAFGFLTLLVLAVVLLGCWAFLRFSDKPTLDRAVTASAIMCLVPNLNQTAIIPYLALLGLFTVFLGVKDFPKYWRGLLVLGVMGIILSLGTLPYSQTTATTFLSGEMVESSKLVVFRDPMGLVMMVVLIPLFLWTGKRIGGVNGAMVACGGVASVVLQSLTAPSNIGLMTVLGRNVFWMWTWMLVMAVWWTGQLVKKPWVKENPASEYVLGALSLGVLVALSISWSAQFQLSAQNEAMLSHDSLKALEWLDKNTAPNEVIATHPLIVSFAVNGLINRQTITTAPSNEGVVNEPCLGGWMDTCSFNPLSEPDWGLALSTAQRLEDKAIRCTLGLKHRGGACKGDIRNLGIRYVMTPTYHPDLPQAFSTASMYVYEVADD